MTSVTVAPVATRTRCKLKEFKEREQLDRSLLSGERQVSPTLEGVEQWHRWRYEQAAEIVQHGDFVLDLGCGIGYGTKMLAAKAEHAVGVDDSAETIEYANLHYKQGNSTFLCKDIFTLPDGFFDTVVAFEILEHTPDPEKFFQLLKRVTAKRFIISAPHEALDATLYPFHYRHFNQEEIAKLIESIGFKVSRLGLSPLAGGQTIIAVGTK